MKAAIDFILGHHAFALSAHQNPEGDAIGSLLGLTYILRRLGKTAIPYARDPAPANVAFLPGLDLIVRDPDALHPADAAIALDCGELERTGPEFSRFAAGRPLLNLDHHATNNRFGAANWVDPEASSTGEMIVRLARELKVPAPVEAALCLYTAILTDTGSFQFSNTRPETLRAAADMIAAGARPELAADRYYHAKPAAQVLLLARCLATLELAPDRQWADAAITTEMFRETGAGPDAAEGIINVITDIESVKVAAIYRQTGPSNWKASLRSKGAFDVAALAAGFGGGGHHNAAGCSLPGSLAEVRAAIRRALDLLLKGV
jgi:phosphoesterase RecJ-like protein